MKRNKFYWLLALVVILSLGLAACGGGATEEPTEEATEEVVADEEAADEEAADEEAADEEAADEEAADEEAADEEMADEEAADEEAADEEMADEEAADEEAAEEEMADEEAADEEVAPDTALRIGLVTDVGEVDDRSFNQSSWEGAQAMVEQFGGEADYIETQDTTDYADNIAVFAEQGYDIIVTVGFALGEATAQAAQDYPDVYFIGVDQFVAEPVDNYVGLIFHEDQAGYLAGVLAANMTESNVIAGVYGTDLIPAVVLFARGFEAGALSVNPDIQVLTTYHPGGMDVAFTDPEWGAGTAAQAIDQGADIIFSAGGKTGNGGLTEVANRTSEDEPLYCIGVDTDQWETVPEAHACLVTSAMKLIPVGIEQIITAFVDGEAPSGNFFGPVGLASFHDFEDTVPADLQEELAALADDLTSGVVETGVTLGGDEEEAAEEDMAEDEAADEEAAEEDMADEEGEAMEEGGEGEGEAMQAGGVVTVAPGDPIRLGFAAALSGEGIEPLGVDELRGVEIAMTDLPAITVGDTEWAIEIDPQDALCSAEGGQTVANRFASDESIAAVIGHMCSSSCTAALAIYEDAGLTMVSPSCTAATLTETASLAFNRSVSTDAIQGPVAADFMFNTLGVTQIATIHDGSTYGEGLVVVTTDAFETLGGEIVAAQAINVGETDFRAVLEEIAAAEPELVYFVGFPAEGARLIEQRADVGLEDIPFMSADGLQTPETIELAGEAAEGIYASAPIPVSSEAFDAFLAAYEEAYDEAPIAPFHGQAYDAYGLIVSAIEATASVDDDGNLVIDRAAVAQAIRDTSAYDGLTGVLDCTDAGECGGAVIEVYVVQDGEFVPASSMDMMDEEGEAMEEGGEGEGEAMQAGGVVTVAPGDPIRLGFAAALSGEGIEPLGVDELRGVEIAMTDLPAITVGDTEWAIEIDPQDALCSAEGGQTVANRFASDESIAAVIGHMCSSSCTAALAIYEDAGLTMVSPSCTAATLTETASLAFNRSVSTDAIQGPVAADFMFNTLGVTQIATIHDGSTYGEGLVVVTTDAFETLGGEIVAAQAINVGETDFRAVLEEIAAAEPELVYFVGFPAEGARLIEQRADVGLEDIPFMSADGLQTPETIELAGEAAEGIYASAPIPVSSEAFDAFLAAYEEAYDEAPIAPFHGQAYDAYGLIVSAIEATASVDDDGNLVIDRAAVAQAIRDTSAYDGLTGVLDCTDAGECGGAVIEVYVVQDGEFVPASSME